MTPMNETQKKKISKLRKKIKKKTDAIIAQEGKKHADELKSAKVVTIYEDQQCETEGCRYNAVGKDTVCQRCGGDRVIRENLLKNEEIPDAIMHVTKYNPANHPMEFIRCAKDGMAEVEIAAKFMVSIYTMRNWAETFTDFNTAYEIGQAMYEAWWQNEGKDNLDNRSYNTGLFKFLTMNNLGWSDKVESKNMNISAGVLVTPAKLEKDDWEDKYAAEAD